MLVGPLMGVRRRPTFVFKTESSSSETTPTALVLAYSLSMKPWSHVLTLKPSTFRMVSSRPSSPLPSPSGREKASCLTNSSGLRDFTRTLRWLPLAFVGTGCPRALSGAASSAARIKGITRAFTASISLQKGVC